MAVMTSIAYQPDLGVSGTSKNIAVTPTAGFPLVVFLATYASDFGTHTEEHVVDGSAIGLTFTKVASVLNTYRRSSMWVSTGPSSGSSGNIVVSAGGVRDLGNYSWVVGQPDSLLDAALVNQVEQHQVTNGTAVSVAGMSAVDPANLCILGISSMGDGSVTCTSDWTAYAGAPGSNASGRGRAFYKLTDNSPTATLSGAVDFIAIAIELKMAAVTATVTTTSPYLQPVPMRSQPGGFQQSGGVLSLRFATSAPPSPPSSATVATNGPAAYIQPIPMRAGPPFGFPLAMPFAFAASPPQAQGASLAAPDGIGYLMKIPMRQGPGGFARGQAAIGGMNGSTSNPIPVTPSTAGTGSRIGRMLRTGKL